MTTPQPHTVWEKSDKLLSGGAIAVRGIAVPGADQLRGAVAVTLSVPAGQFQLSDGSVTATVLFGPAEALGVGAWLRDGAAAAAAVGPPLFDWPADGSPAPA